jgi:hypothetical protein
MDSQDWCDVKGHEVRHWPYVCVQDDRLWRKVRGMWMKIQDVEGGDAELACYREVFEQGLTYSEDPPQEDMKSFSGLEAFLCLVLLVMSEGGVDRSCMDWWSSLQFTRMVVASDGLHQIDIGWCEAVSFLFSRPLWVS